MSNPLKPWLTSDWEEHSGICPIQRMLDEVLLNPSPTLALSPYEAYREGWERIWGEKTSAPHKKDA